MNIRDIFKSLTPIQSVENELVEAEMSLLKAETGVEYAQSLVNYNKNRIKRLRAYLNDLNTENTVTTKNILELNNGTLQKNRRNSTSIR